jgi:hypothetical protein
MQINSRFEYYLVQGMKIINYRHVLMRTLIGLVHLKLNYESWETTAAWIGSPCVHTLVVDELNERRFFIKHENGFSIGTLINDEFVIGAEQEFDLDDLQWPKLSGDKLIGFCNVDEEASLWKFCQVDLNTLTEERIDVPSALNDYRWVNFYT